MAKHKDGRPSATTAEGRGAKHRRIPTHGGPVTGNGHGSDRAGMVKGVTFRQADGSPAVPPAAGTASRLFNFLVRRPR